MDSSYLKRIKSGKETAPGKGRSNKSQSLWEIKGRNRRPVIARNSRKMVPVTIQNARALLLTKSNPQALRVGS